MTSHLFTGKLMHTRRDQVRHKFVYSVFMLLLDLDDLPALDKTLPRFGYNRRAACAVYDRDHLPNPDGAWRGIRQMVLERAAAQGIDPGPGAKVYMLTNPRILGYVFNPITVYYLQTAAGEWCGGLAEVNNTHGEQHPYLLHEGNRIPSASADETKKQMRRYGVEKQFYVSPWIGMNARYEMALTPVTDHMIVHIDEYRGEDRFFQARLWGDLRPLTAATLRGALLRFPFMTLRVTAAIHWEGIKIHLKGGPFYRRRKAYTQQPPPQGGFYREYK